jgi:hypothetical protein
VSASDAQPVGGFAVLIDAEHKPHRARGVAEPAFYLIRPDGVVAMRGRGVKFDVLAEYFERNVSLLHRVGIGSSEP